MYYYNFSGISMSFATQYQNYTLPINYADELNGFIHTHSGMSSNLTAQVDGLYDIYWRAVGSGENNAIYVGSVFVNNVGQEKCKDEKKMTAGGDITSLSNSCFIRLSAGGNINIKVADYSGTGTGVYYDGKLKMVRV